jgi:hypothetical protein
VRAEAKAVGWRRRPPNDVEGAGAKKKTETQLTQHVPLVTELQPHEKVPEKASSTAG